MERITSRKNPLVYYMKELGTSANARTENGEMLCRGKKLLKEALAAGLHVGTVLFSGEEVPAVVSEKIYSVPQDILDYISKGEPELLFTCPMPKQNDNVQSAVVLEEVQDPGNVGTVIRTAAAFKVDTVILLGASADPYGPKALRASMGAAFRINVIRTDITGFKQLIESNGLDVCAAVLADDAVDIRQFEPPHKTALAIGNEGHGLSDELIAVCSSKIIIPMDSASESLNAAAAAAVAMWELFGKKQ